MTIFAPNKHGDGSNGSGFGQSFDWSDGGAALNPMALREHARGVGSRNASARTQSWVSAVHDGARPRTARNVGRTGSMFRIVVLSPDGGVLRRTRAATTVMADFLVQRNAPPRRQRHAG